MSIRIIEIFVKMRELILTNKDILLQLEKVEKKISTHHVNIRQLYEIVKQLTKQEDKPKTPIGFKTKNQDDKNS